MEPSQKEAESWEFVEIYRDVSILGIEAYQNRVCRRGGLLARFYPKPL
jgi:hypothetical protein